MPYVPTVWEDEVPDSSPVKYKLEDDTAGVLGASVEITTVTDITPGTPLNASKMNKIEAGIEAAQAAAEAAQADADAAQTDADKGVFMYGLRDLVVFIPLNGPTPLTISDKAYYRIPFKGAGGVFTGTLINVEAMCGVGSSSGAVTLTVKNGATSMLSTNITLDAGETDTLTAAARPAVGASNAVQTGDHILIEATGSGVGVTYCGVELTIRPDDV
jgi:hypothetical protein